MAFDWDGFRKEIFAWDKAHSDMDVMTRDSMIIERILSERPIVPCPEERFFYDPEGWQVTWQLVDERLRARVPDLKHLVGDVLAEGAKRRGYSGDPDIGHTAPDFENVFRLGLPGLLKRLETYAERAETEEQHRYYEAGIRTWRAIISYVKRAAEETGNEEQAAALRALAHRTPETLYEAIQLTILYYMFQHRFDCSRVRTLGRLDHLYEPFRAADVASGRLDDESVRKMIGQMLCQVDSWKVTANMPFAVGGTGEDGRSAANAMSAILIEVYSQLALPHVKLHFLYTEDMPSSLVRTALDAVRKGANSICFLSDRTVTESLLRRGEDADDARNYAVVGCYECGGRGELTCSCNARVNIPKAIEMVFGNGRDMTTDTPMGLVRTAVPETYEDFLVAFY